MKLYKNESKKEKKCLKISIVHGFIIAKIFNDNFQWQVDMGGYCNDYVKKYKKKKIMPNVNGKYEYKNLK